MSKQQDLQYRYGDHVICTKRGASAVLQIGKEYIVNRLSKPNARYIGLKDVLGAWPASNFKPITPTEVGQRVRFLYHQDEMYGTVKAIGRKVPVVSVSYDDGTTDINEVTDLIVVGRQKVQEPPKAKPASPDPSITTTPFSKEVVEEMVRVFREFLTTQPDGLRLFWEFRAGITEVPGMSADIGVRRAQTQERSFKIELHDRHRGSSL